MKYRFVNGVPGLFFYGVEVHFPKGVERDELVPKLEPILGERDPYRTTASGTKILWRESEWLWYTAEKADTGNTFDPFLFSAKVEEIGVQKYMRYIDATGYNYEAGNFLE